MIVGTGIDITEVGRIRHSLERFGERFLSHIYTPGEIAYCQSRKVRAAESFAARFAAKEAGAKALGTGIGHGVMWKEIEGRREPGRAPTLLLAGRAAEWAAHLRVRNISLSLTHTAQLAMAMVTMESAEQ